MGGVIHRKLAVDNLPSHTLARNTNNLDEVPIVEVTVKPGEKNQRVVSMHVKEVPAENYCKKKDCREWPQCCASNHNRDYYQR